MIIRDGVRDDLYDSRHLLLVGAVGFVNTTGIMPCIDLNPYSGVVNTSPSLLATTTSEASSLSGTASYLAALVS
jgi:hypothetical protein